MSVGLIPVFSAECAATFDALGEALAAELDELEHAAGEAGLTPFGAFADQRVVPEEFGGSPDDLDELLGPCEDWFEPEAGAAAVERLLRFIQSADGSQVALEDRPAIVAELNALRSCLKKAARTNVKFRLTLA